MKVGSLAVVVLPLVVGGCKGRLPNVKTVPATTTAIRYLPGESVTEFPGEVVLGPIPKQNPDTVYVVSRLPYDGRSNFFYHYRLFPKVHWIQYGTDETLKATLKDVETLQKKKESIEGLTLMSFNRSVGRYTAVSSSIGDYSLIKNGVLVGQCFESDLDRTIMKVIEGKIDTAAQRKEVMVNAKWLSEYVRYNRRLLDWAMRHGSEEELYAEIRQTLPKVQGKRARGGYLSTFLIYAGCQPFAKIKTALMMIRPDDFVGEGLASDIANHAGHTECRERRELEFAIAVRSPEVVESPSILLSLAINAIDLGKKKEAESLLKKMVACKSLQPRFARLLKEHYEQEYENLMWQIRH